MNCVFQGVIRSFWLGALVAGPMVASAQPVPFETVPAAVREVSREHIFDAVIEAVHESTVSAQTSGRILAVYFDVDDYVPKGGILLRFKDTEHRARLEQAQASLKEAAARNKEARDQFDRMEDLFAQKHVSKSDMDRARADVAKAAAAAKDAATRQRIVRTAATGQSSTSIRLRRSCRRGPSCSRHPGALASSFARWISNPISRADAFTFPTRTVHSNRRL